MSGKDNRTWWRKGCDVGNEVVMFTGVELQHPGYTLIEDMDCEIFDYVSEQLLAIRENLA